MKDFFKKLFCRHNYRLYKLIDSTGFFDEKFTVPIYKCEKCSKVKLGNFDYK